MRFARPTFAALGAVSLAIMLTGCPVKISRPRSAGPAFAKPATEPPSAPSGQMPLDLKGNYVHAGTGIEFPEKAAGWTRHAPKRYDREGNDVGIGYHRTVGDNRIELTIHVFPRPWKSATEPMGLDEEFERETAEVRKVFASVKAATSGSGAAPFRGTVVAGRTIALVATRQRTLDFRPVSTRLTTYAFDPWRLKYRVTTPGMNGEALRVAVDELTTQLHLLPLVPPDGPGVASADDTRPK